MFAAYAELNVGTGLFTQVGRHLNQFADAALVESGKRIGLEYLFIVIFRQEFSGIIAAEPKVIVSGRWFRS